MRRPRKKRMQAKETIGNKESGEAHLPGPLYDTIEENIKQVVELLGSPIDLGQRYIQIGETTKRCGLVYIQGQVDKHAIDEMIIKNIMNQPQSDKVPHNGEQLLDYLTARIISVSSVKKESSFDQIILPLLEGNTILFVDHTQEALVVCTQSEWEGRSIEEPVTEPLIRGPRDGFTESVKTNITLLRNRIQDYNLRIDIYRTGRRSKKILALGYINGIIHDDLLKEVKRRLNSIDIDDAMESGIIEQWIEDSFLSPFPQLTGTERPDKVAASLMNGQFCIILDGTPFVLIAPTTVTDTLHSPEDYYERWMTGTLLRLLRYTSALITVFLPAAYIALASFHPGMIPSQLAFSMASTREGVPFPAALEALLMETTMELLREAGVRLPKPIGQTIGIVGGLVIGEAAVTAGIVSPIMVIIVAITAIASFSLPYYGLAISLRMLRFLAMIGAAIFGLYGIILVFIMISVHLANMKSFGVPFTVPIAPSFFKDWKESMIRAPITMLNMRYKYMQTKDAKRLKKG